MRVHRALGLAGGAGGVDQDRQVLGPTAAHALHQLVRDAARCTRGPARAASSRLITPGSSRSRRPSMSNTTILLQPRQLRAHFQRLVQLLVVLHEQDAGAGVLAQVLHLRRPRRWGRCRWTRRRRTARPGRPAPIRCTVLDRMEAVSPRREAQAHQAAGDLAHGLAGLRPGPAAPDAQLLLAHPDLRRRAAPRRSRTSRGWCRPRARRRVSGWMWDRSQRLLHVPLIASSSSSSSAARRARRLPSCPGRTP